MKLLEIDAVYHCRIPRNRINQFWICKIWKLGFCSATWTTNQNCQHLLNYKRKSEWLALGRDFGFRFDFGSRSPIQVSKYVYKTRYTSMWCGAMCMRDIQNFENSANIFPYSSSTQIGPRQKYISDVRFLFLFSFPIKLFEHWMDVFCICNLVW